MNPNSTAFYLLIKGVMKMVAAMKQGSVIVDLAAETGGNCAVTKTGELYVHKGVKIVGYTDLPSRLPTQSSTLYSNNVTKFLLSIGGEGRFAVHLEEEVVRGSIVLHNGVALPPAPRAAPPPVAAPSAAKVAEAAEARALTPWQKVTREVALVTGGMGSVVALGKLTGPAFMSNFFTFGLAGLIGYRVVWGVAPALHSPLMSVTNAISGEQTSGAVYDRPWLTRGSCRYGWCWRHVRDGWRIPPGNDSSGYGCSVCLVG